MRSGAGKKGSAFSTSWNRILRFLLPCMVVAVITTGSAGGQEVPSAGSAEPLPAANESSLSNWTNEPVAPLSVEPSAGEVVQPRVQPPATAVFSDVDQQIPVLRVRGEYFDPSGLCSLGTLSEESNQAIKERMLKDSAMGFRCFMLRVDWPGVQPEPNRIDNARVRDLLSYANDLGSKVIISLELNRAPAWFFQGAAGSGRVMVSYLVDPEMETAVGNDGDLRWANGTGIPIFYHPDTVLAVGKLILSLYYSLKDERSLLGWYISGPVTLAYPGGGNDGIVGMCDYSPYTVNKYNQVTGEPLMAYPLPRWSQGTRDTRPSFRAFRDLRIEWKRESFDGIVRLLNEVDRDHIILTGMDPVLNYRNDNGYLAMLQAPDSTRQLIHDGVDGAVIHFRLASDSFEAMPHRTESSATHLLLTINQVVRNGRLAIVLVEEDIQYPPNTADIPQLAWMLKAAGAYPLWCSGFSQRRSQRWSWDQDNAIESTQPISLLPPPNRLRRGQVGILDLPKFYTTYYAEQNNTISQSLLQLAIHQRTGVILETVGIDELSLNKPILDQYTNLIYLTPELTTSQEAKSWIDPGTQIELAAYRALGGVIEAVDPMLLTQYEIEDFNSPVLEDELRTRYVHRGAAADLLNGADAFIVANDPYVFIRINNLRSTRYVDVKLEGWPQARLGGINMVDIPNIEPLRVPLTSGNASFTFRPVTNTSYLYILRDDYEPISRPYENRRTAMVIAQRSRNMRRSIPAALLLAALLAVTLLWMSFQSQHKSLLQAAELVDRRRSMGPLDILDDAEVMAFYKTYASNGEQGQAEKGNQHRGSSSE